MSVPKSVNARRVGANHLLVVPRFLVRFDGTHNPWETVEHVYSDWVALGRPQQTEIG